MTRVAKLIEVVYSLIMLLIQSNVFRAMWLFIDPMVALTNGALQSGSVFCNVSGFLYAVGTEASGMEYLLLNPKFLALSSQRYRLGRLDDHNPHCAIHPEYD